MNRLIEVVTMFGVGAAVVGLLLLWHVSSTEPKR